MSLIEWKDEFSVGVAEVQTKGGARGKASEKADASETG